MCRQNMLSPSRNYIHSIDTNVEEHCVLQSFLLDPAISIMHTRKKKTLFTGIDIVFILK